ncbi:hypothetical protein MXB_3387, partial [Myxobolus squamalis]
QVSFFGFLFCEKKIRPLKSVKNLCKKIVPRLRIDQDIFLNIFITKTAIETDNKLSAISEYIAAFISENEFDGMVLECLPLVSGEYGLSEGNIWIKAISDALFHKNLTFVVVISPLRRKVTRIHVILNHRKISTAFSQDSFYRMIDYVSYFSIMTYDFSPKHKQCFNFIYK